MIRTTNMYEPAHDLSLQTKWKTGEEAWQAIRTSNNRMRPILTEGRLVPTYFAVLHACVHRLLTASYAYSCMTARKTYRRAADLSTRKRSPLPLATCHVCFRIRRLLHRRSTLLPSLWSYYPHTGLHKIVQSARFDRERRQRRA